MKADPDRQEIAVDGVAVSRDRPKPVYLMLNKPRGYVTTLSDERGRPTAAQLVADCGTRVWPVGRLDLNSEGLLLFTNDGELTNRLLHPSHEVEKQYLVRVSGPVENGIRRLKEPMRMDGVLLRAPKVRRMKSREDAPDRALLSITITEGKNRQIRRMCDAAQLRVLRLKRVREGPVELGDLHPGTWRFLKNEEVEALLRG